MIKNVDTGEVLSLAPNYDNNLAFNSEIPNSFSLYLLKSYIQTFGIQPHQIDYISKLTKSSVKSIHDKIVTEMGLEPSSMEFYLQKLYEVIDFLSKN